MGHITRPDISKYYFHLAFRCSFYYNARATAPLRKAQQSQVGYCDKNCCNQNQAATQFLSRGADGDYITCGCQSAVFVVLYFRQFNSISG